jgi:GNAT superfamily N-acetyltransferase
MGEVALRDAQSCDVPLILHLIRELAIYEREPDAVVATEEMLHDALFGAEPAAYALIGELDGEAVGFALYFFNFSTWLGTRGIHLEDLYVTPEARGAGVGKALLRAVAKAAVDRGCGRYEWNVLRWNTPSIEFYESFGAEPLEEWVGYRLDGAALERFASGK